MTERLVFAIVQTMDLTQIDAGYILFWYTNYWKQRMVKIFKF